MLFCFVLYSLRCLTGVCRCFSCRFCFFFIGSVFLVGNTCHALLILDAMLVCCDGDVRQVDWSPLCLTRAALGWQELVVGAGLWQLQSPKHSQMIYDGFLISVNLCACGHYEHDNQCVFKLGGGSSMSWFNTCPSKMPSPDRGNIGRIPNWPSFPARQWDLFERLTLSYFEAKQCVFPEQKTSNNSFFDVWSWILPWCPWGFWKVLLDMCL